MGSFISSFAIHSIASVAAFVPRVIINTGRNDAPRTGFTLALDWVIPGVVFGLLAVVHFVLIFATLLPASRVLVPESIGMLGMAKLMGPGMGAGDGAGVGKGKGIEVAYGWTDREAADGESWRNVLISAEVEPRRMVWPDGEYDMI